MDTTSEPAPGSTSRAAEARPAAAADRAPGRDIIVVGASAGGVEALQGLVAALPSALDAALFVVLHMRADSRSHLAAILGRAGALPVVTAQDGMPIVPGRVMVAPPDSHLLVEPGRATVVRGPRENRHRPAIDPLFRSAAWAYGPRVVGVVLSGGLDDGTAGLWAIKSCGGVTVVQDPADAQNPDMPQNALTHNRIDHRLPVGEIGALLTRLAKEPVAGTRPPAPPQIKTEVEFAKLNGSVEDVQRLGSLSPFTCPSCRGALWELDEGGHLRYRCHTGHAFSQDSLLVDQDSTMETAIYTALRAVEEKAVALRRLATRWADTFPIVRADYEQRADELEQAADSLRTLLARAAP